MKKVNSENSINETVPLQKYFDSLNLGIIVTNGDFKVQYSNHNAEKLFFHHTKMFQLLDDGWDNSSIVGKNLSAIIEAHEDLNQLVHSYDGSYKKGKISISDECFLLGVSQLKNSDEWLFEWFELEASNQSSEDKRILEAFSKSQAMITFDPSGNILNANDNFLQAMGYSLEEVVGKHHNIFMPPGKADSEDYKVFWQNLKSGKFNAGQFKRVNKAGDDVWIQASYNPIFDDQGNVTKVVKYASDVTRQVKKLSDYEGQVNAICRSQAVIEFEPDGTILNANGNFLNAVGYKLEEIKGKHHSLFVDANYKSSSEYQSFWQDLACGKFFSGEFKRVNKQGKEFWIQASYNPIFDPDGKPFKVVKYASDITAQKVQNADSTGQIEAIGKSQAVIEFNMDGTIIDANKNFLNAVGYTLDEIKGQHHRMFVTPSYGASHEYKKFWEKLNKGEYDSGEYMRVTKSGKEIWIQASYNPILDLNGSPVKVVKYASDITEQKAKNADFSGQIAAISKSQAVIEFNMDGTIINANDNFLNAVGYSLSEIQGQHHRIFVESDHGNSKEYQSFWEKLNRGEYDTGEYQRFGKHGKEVWIQASYNPILDSKGNPYKVVKYATDITGRKTAIAVIRQALGQVSDGDLTTQVEDALEGEFNMVAESMNNLVTQLSSLVSEIRTTSNSVFSASREMAQGNNDLSQRTETQAANLEETAAAMEQLTATVQQNAKSASEATGKANTAMTRASNGGEVVQNAVGAMEEINKSSKKISDIIGVIDEIAFQTNLLALNAAVEAARAGEQGRGFAVVAAEVRNLAQRSASAAKEIKGLINDSVDAVSKGTKLVHDTGNTFEELVSAVQEVVAMVSSIDNASREQSAGITEVGKAVSQMDEMTQQNAALVEQASASSRSMEEMAQNLLKQVRFFDLGGE